MRYIQTDFNKPVPYAVAFPDWDVYQHGRDEVAFGVSGESVDNPTDVTVELRTSNRLLEVADWDDGSSGHGSTMGGDRNIELYDVNGRTICVLKYRNGSQPKLYVNGIEVDGGANRITSFVSLTGAPAEDPKPQSVMGTEFKETYKYNRDTGQAAYSIVRVRIYRLNTIEGEAYAALSLRISGHTPKTDTVYPAPETCPACGK